MKNYFNFLINLILALTSLPAYPQTSAVGGQSMLQNYTLNGGFENSTHGWKTYKNTAAITPVTGAGGTPTTTLTTSTSSPLAGKSSGVMTHPASNVQGEGISYDFAIDAGAKGSVIGIRAVYQTVSGTYSGGSPGVESDVEVYVYDKDNGVLIQPSVYKLDGGVAGVNYALTTNFQSSYNATNYRLIFHYSTTSTSAFSVKIDSIMTSLQSPATSDGRVISSQMASGSAAAVTLATRITNFTTVYDSTGSLSAGAYTVPVSGYYEVKANSVTRPSGTGNTVAVYKNGVNTTPLYSFNFATGLNINLTGLATLYANQGDILDIRCDGSITSAWGNVTFTRIAGPTSGDEGRVVAMKVTQSLPTATVTTTQSLVKFTSGIAWDTNGSFSTSTGLYTCPVTGYYRATVQLAITNSAGAGSNVQVAVAQNGSVSAANLSAVSIWAASVQTGFPIGSFVLLCNAGDTLAPYAAVSTASSPSVQSNGINFFSVERLSGPTGNATANTNVRARASSTSLAVGTTMALLKPATINFDSTGAYNATSGLFTCPVSGIYQVNARVFTGAVALNTGGNCGLAIFKNNAYFGTVALIRGTTASAQSYMLNGIDEVSCAANETLGIGAYCDVGNTATQVDAFYQRTGN